MWGIKLKGYPWQSTLHIFYTSCHSSLSESNQQHLWVSGMWWGIGFFLLSNPTMYRGSGFPDKIKWGSSVEALRSDRDELLPLLARTLLFFLPHPLHQLLTDISQRVHFGREGLYCLAEPDGLRFTTMKAKHRRRVMWLLNVEDADRAKQQRRKKVKSCLQEFAFLWLFHLTEVCRLSSLHRPEERRHKTLITRTHGSDRITIFESRIG